MARKRFDEAFEDFLTFTRVAFEWALHFISKKENSLTGCLTPLMGVTPHKLAALLLWVGGLQLSDYGIDSVRYYQDQRPTPRPAVAAGLESLFANNRCQAHGSPLSAG